MKNLNIKMALTLLLCVAGFSAFAQTTVRGRVTGSEGEPLYGATVIVEGTSTVAVTDSDGRYTVEVRGPGDVLNFSYVGAEPQSIVVGGRSVIDVAMEDDQWIDPVVVIGYGQQRKSVVTAAISSVSDAVLERATPIRLDDALKGLTAGVMVTSESGQPGAGSQVRIRGMGTINENKPLYVVDGMPMTDGIDYLAPADIERIDILKDAASAAVYGTRGANGVILVTTKSGATSDRVRVTYDFQYGLQNPWRHLDVLNATEYAVIMNDRSLNGGGGIVYPDPYSMGKGTDWQKEVFNKNAPVLSHQLSVSGKSGRNTYYISASYLSEDGTIGGNFDRSNYKRFTVRLNDTYSLMDKSNERNWLNKLDLTTNTSYSRTLQRRIEPNSHFGSVLGSAVYMSPLIDVYTTDEMEATYRELHPGYNFVRDRHNGRLFTLPSAIGSYGEMYNPVAYLNMDGTKYNYHRFVSNFDATLGIWDGLSFKSSFGVDMRFNGEDGWTPIYYLNGNNSALFSSVYSDASSLLTWQVENVLSYDKVFAEKHSVNVLLGQSALETTGRNLRGSNRDMIEEDPDRANLGFTTGDMSKQSASGGLWDDYRLASLFARASYSYDDRYMIQGTVRRDGSSRFGPDNRFAIFPSVSAGWNIRNEAFMEDRAPWLSNLKLRASWGKNGNDQSVGAFAYIALTQTGNDYILGSGPNGTEYIANGTKSSGVANPGLKWEESVQTDVGIDAGFLNGALNVALDYYKKRTEGMIIEMPIPAYVGDNRPMGNVGTMDNSGFEFEVNYRHHVGAFNFWAGGNLTYLKNKLVNLGNDEGFQMYDSFRNYEITRGENGQPFPFFYGYKTDGIFQNVDELDDHSWTGPDKDGKIVTKRIQPDAAPGDVRFVDRDGDGEITENDRTKIGKGSPDWVFGFNAGFDWKGIDFSMIWQGVAGADVFDATWHPGTAPTGNLPRWALDRWTGPGSSNKIPRFTSEGAATTDNWLASDLYVKDGSYLRLKNITLGYTLPERWTSKAFVSRLRVYVTATNLLTFTKYDGFDPEISSGSVDNVSLGLDKGVYPQSRVFYFGVNLNF